MQIITKRVYDTIEADNGIIEDKVESTYTPIEDEVESVNIMIPYDHNKLLNLDYSNSGHTGFMPQDISILPQGTIDITQNSLSNTLISIFQENEAKQVSLKEIKKLNTKIINTDDIQDTNVHNLSIGDYVYLETEDK